MSVAGITDREIEDAVEEYLISKNEPLVDESPTSIPINEPTTIIADEKPPLTRSEIKKLRRQFITVVNQRVQACGHKYDPTRQPRHRNCENCWMAWLNNHGELIQTTDELFQTEGGIEMILQLQGVKFLKMFKRFMSTIAKLKAQEENTNANID